MYMDYDDFEKATAGAVEVFKTWEDLIKEFTNVAREVTKKRSEKFLPIKINPAHAKLQERVNFIRNFRKQHEQLHQTILKVMTKPTGLSASKATSEIEETESVSLSDVNAVEEVKLAYESVKNVDVLDVSHEGTEIWVTAEVSYNERVSRVENQIIARLRDRLGIAKNANEMFRVFSKFNALFVRPKIRGAIQEYQTQLIDKVKDDIKKLHDKFKMQYRHSDAYYMSQLRDLPPISGAIIWARQIERQLSTYMKRVEDVLGKGWELYAEGQKLQSESSSFRKKLDTRPIYEAWFTEITRRELAVSGPLFEITRNRAQGNVLQLGVNFDAQIITLFKEVRNLLWLKYQVPHQVSIIAKDAKHVYPVAVSLMETIRTYSQMVNKVQRHSEIATLVAGYRNDAQKMVSKGVNLRWEHFANTYGSVSTYINPGTFADARENRHIMFVREFASVVSIFQDKVDSLISIYDDIMKLIDELPVCAFIHSTFSSIILRIQKLIDRLNLESYSNLDQWVTELDAKIEAVLVNRLQQAIKAWMLEYQRDDLEESGDSRDSAAHGKNKKRRANREAERTSALTKANEVKPTLKVLVHEIRIKNQVMYLDPPVEQARVSWYSQLHEWLSVVCTLTRIQSSRYEIGLAVKDSLEDLTYSDLVNSAPLCNAILDKGHCLKHVANMFILFQYYP